LRNGTSDFIEVDASATITLLGLGSGSAALAPASSFRGEQENHCSPPRSTVQS
jgi:hypothetical protein